MKRRSIPESELISSFLGYATAGFFLVNTPFWVIAFAVAFVLAEAVGSWAKLLPLVWVGAWVGLVPVVWVGFVVVAGTGAAGATAGAAGAGAVAWFVLWAVSRHVAFALPHGRFTAAIRALIFSLTGAVTWFVFGSVAGRVAWAMHGGQSLIVAMVVAWAWAWAWAWFVFEALAGVVIGGIAWVAVGFGIGIFAGVGVPVWTWAMAGAVAGFVVAAVSKARKELLKSFSKSHTFFIMAGICLLGLSSGRLVSELLF